jgi:hypothetical protein
LPFDPSASSSETPPSRLALTLDMEKYLGQLGDWDITEEQKEQFITALWGLLVSFAEIGFEIHPVQQAQNACGQVGNNPPKPALTAPDGLYLEDQRKSELKACAHENESRPEDGKGAT